MIRSLADDRGHVLVRQRIDPSPSVLGHGHEPLLSETTQLVRQGRLLHAQVVAEAAHVARTVVVQVDGITMSSGWTWVASTNSIDMDAPPAAGSTVTVTYAEAGGCP